MIRRFLAVLVDLVWPTAPTEISPAALHYFEGAREEEK